MSRAFVDYYSENDISPVRQDISDLRRHFGRRSALYHLLGIAPAYVRDGRVLEFGPGSGHNALYTASLQPAHYTLVDANPRGVRESREILRNSVLPLERYQVVKSLVEEFRSEQQFDLVLAEGMIPFQHDPAAMAANVADFVVKGGLLVLTCADSASIIGEVGRRLLASRLSPATASIAERLPALRRIFTPHLATLAGMSRPVDDWICDNITQPWTGRTFSLADAISVLGTSFELFATSPRFGSDWRWYKDVYGENRSFNERFSMAYRSNIANFLDYRIELPPHDVRLGDEIIAITDRLYALMQATDRGEQDALASAADTIEQLRETIAPLSASTAVSLQALVAALKAPIEDVVRLATGFAAHFGRGQQYASLVRVRTRPNGVR